MLAKIALIAALFVSNAYAQSAESMRDVIDAELDKVIESNDSDGDGLLSKAEVTILFNRRLGMSDAEIYTLCTCTIASTMTTYGGADGKLNKAEMLTLAIENKELGPVIAKRLQNIPEVGGGSGGGGDMMSNIINPRAEVLDATATTKITMEIQGNPALYKGDRDFIKGKIATLMSVDPGALVVEFAAKTATAAASSRRKLASAPIVYDTTATGYFTSEAAAASAQSSVSASMGSAADASAFLEYTVPTDPAVEKGAVAGMQSMPMGSFAYLVIALLGPILLCIFAKVVAGSERAKKGAEFEGCCKSGCCSFYALKAYAGSEMAAAILLIIACIILMGAVTGFVNALVGILEEIVRATTIGGQVGQMTSALPASIIDTINSNIETLKLIPVFVAIPGFLAGALLLIVSLCGFKSGDKFCCTKCVIMLAFTLLWLAFILYFILCVVSAAMFVPEVQAQLRKLLAICDTGLPTLRQTVVDAEALLAQIDAMPAGTIPAAQRDTVATLVTEGRNASDLFAALCGHIQNMIRGIEGFLGPALFCISAIVYAMYTNMGVCCSTGCCKTPEDSGAKVAPS